MKSCSVEPKRFIRYDENGIDNTPAVGLDEAMQISIDFILATRIDHQWI